ncbi:hypothetical protein N7454_005946 [Penicillium verhagenii]|nr:hypothetical protein N7454_005946 [Penicillium verhagenii]
MSLPIVEKPRPTHTSKPSFANSIDTFLSVDTKTWDWSRFSPTKDLESQQSRPSLASLRYHIFSIYRRLFTLVYIVNVIAFIIIMVSSREKTLAFVNAAGINLLVCGLARHPMVVNAIFLTVCRVSVSAPFWLRKKAAEAYHYGGVHSGCGVASFLWYTGLVGLISREYWANNGAGTITLPIIIIAYILLGVLLGIIIVAHPVLRAKRHDYFELVHRFSAWTAVALFLTLLLVFSDQARKAQGLSFGQYLTRLPAFWVVILIVITIVHPWTLLRRVQVKPEVLSSHATRLHFDHTSTNFGKVIGLSNHPLKDWHSFATFPDPDSKSWSVIVSRAGDWTARCIAEQPTHLWKRGVLMYGFIHVMRLFRRVVVVATGSGIGPCLSFLSEKRNPQLRLIWQTRSPKRTYGPDVLSFVHRLDPNPLLIDTGNSGRIDMVPTIQEMARDFDAEAVCVISNPHLTKKIVYELRASGTPAFGPIFDS